MKSNEGSSDRFQPCDHRGCDQPGTFNYPTGLRLCARHVIGGDHEADARETSEKTPLASIGGVSRASLGLPTSLGSQSSRGSRGFSRRPDWISPRDIAERKVDLVARRCETLSIPAPGEPDESCLLHPDHDHLAKLVVGRYGFWQYTCDWLAKPLSLAETRGALAHLRLSRVDPETFESIEHSPEKVKRPGRVEVSRWLELLDFEAGLLIPAAVPIILPTALTAAGRAVGRDIALFLGLRNRLWGRQPFTYTRKFSMARLLLPVHVARAGIEDLLRVGSIVRVDANDASPRDPYRYKLGLPEGRTTDQVAAMLVYEFDAIEEPRA